MPGGTPRHWSIVDLDPPVKELYRDLPTILLFARAAGGYCQKEHSAFVDWLALVWPQSRRSWFAVSAQLFAANIDWSEAEWANRRRLEPLFEPWTAIGLEAALLLAVALQAREPGEQGLAVEATIALLSDGRLKPDQICGAIRQLGEVMAEQPASRWPDRVLQPRRFADAMGRVAAASAAHAAVAQEIVAATLRFFAIRDGAVTVPIGQLTAPLRLLVELGAQLERPVPAVARPTLEQLASGSGETARLARRLLG